MWKTVELADVCDLITCGVAKRPDYVETGIPFLSAKNVKKQKVIWDDYKHITPEAHRALTKHNKPEIGDVLYTRVGSFGEAAIVDKDVEFSIFVSLTLIKPKPILLNKFLIYYLNSPMGKSLAKKGVSSSGVGNLNVGVVRKFPIPLPPLAEQQRIVAKLDAAFAEIDSAIEAAEKNFDNAKAIINSGLAEIFQNEADSWEVKKLSEVCMVERGSSPRPIKQYFTNDDGVNWIKIGDTEQDGKYITSTKQKITAIGAKKSRHVKVGDFILTNSMSYGRPYIMGIEGYIHDGWFVLRLNKDIDTEYFYYLLISPYVQHQFHNLAAGAVVKNISGDLVKKTILPIPPLERQKGICKKIVEIEAQTQQLKETYKLKFDNLNMLKRGILAQELQSEAA
tara:strand:+ start:286 stop:1467 length:1182 start_codon:yes stop_codon:yes gene_type:complete